MKQIMLLLALIGSLVFTSCNQLEETPLTKQALFEQLPEDALFLQLEDIIHTTILTLAESYTEITTHPNDYQSLGVEELLTLFSQRSNYSSLEIKLTNQFELLRQRYPFLATADAMQELNELIVQRMQPILETLDGVRMMECFSCVKSFHTSFNSVLISSCLNGATGLGFIDCYVAGFANVISALIQEITFSIANIFDPTECACRTYLHDRCNAFSIFGTYICEAELDCYSSIPDC